ncbi:hypothetical protein BGY98DRAFT_1189288 [Russula aff. rugulosa BPL654]|nr:hypothetical protein BGY98DRAFT_1189288 [Russula aff. rugulosa BPL654]
MADEGEDMRIVSGKRAELEGTLGRVVEFVAGLTTGATANVRPSKWGSSGDDNPIQVPSSASGGHRPWYSLDDIRWSSYSPGGTALPWKSPDDTGPHSITPGRDRPQLFRPGTTNKIEPGWSVRTRPPNKPTTEIESGETPPPSSGKVVPPSDQIIPPSPSEVLPPPEQVPPESSSEVLPSSEQVPPKSSSEEGLAQTPTMQQSPSPKQIQDIFEQPAQQIQDGTEQSGHQLQDVFQQPAQQIQGGFQQLATNSKTFFSNLPSKSKAVFSNLATNSKTFFSNVASKSKSLFGKLAGKPKVLPVVL